MTPPLQPLIHPNADPFLTEDQPDPPADLWPTSVLDDARFVESPCGPVPRGGCR